MTDRDENLWAGRKRARHAELYDAEYAKQLERIARIRNEVSASLPVPPPPPRPLHELPLREPAAARWDAAPANLALAPVAAPPRLGTTDAPGHRAAPRRDGTPDHHAAPRRDSTPDHHAAPRRDSTPDHHEAPRRDSTPDHHAAPRRDSTPDRHAAPRRDDPPDLRANAPRRGGTLAGGAARRSRATGRRTRWLVAAAGLAALLGIGGALLAARAPEAPAATVFRVPGQPTGLVASGGQVWVAGPMAGAVWILDGDSGRPAAPPLRTGGTPARVALDARFAWIADTERGAVVRASRAGASAHRLLRAGPDVSDVAVTAGAVWTASSADGTVRVLDARGRRQTIHVGERPIALAADSRRVVALGAAGTLTRLSARSRRPIGPPVTLGGAPVDVALSGDRAWVADARAGTVRSVALSSGLVGPAVRVGRAPVAIAADAAGIYVLCRGDRTLVRLEEAGSVTTRVPLDHTPIALALDPQHVWIAAGTNEVIRVDR